MGTWQPNRQCAPCDNDLVCHLSSSLVHESRVNSSVCIGIQDRSVPTVGVMVTAFLLVRGQRSLETVVLGSRPNVHLWQSGSTQ